MRFHIRRSAADVTTHCGFDAYTSTSQHLATEAAVENPNRPWFEGDSICLACVRSARKPRPKDGFLACMQIGRGELVVHCPCGGVKAAGWPCGGGAW